MVISESINNDEILYEYKYILPTDDKSIQSYAANLPVMSSYIVFTVTRNAVYWNMVEFPFPSTYFFSGTMTIFNITMGQPCNTYATMHGRSGVVSYTGNPGHQYHMSFAGDVKDSKDGSMVHKGESGGCTWIVPAG